MVEGLLGAGPVLNGLFKIGQTVYAMIAVTGQARDLLDSACHVTASVETVRSLRRQKSGLLQSEEKKWVDRVINDTEKTLNNVASLVEPARVDMQTNAGKIGFVNRALFVFRDSPKVATNFARLTLTSQSLNTALTMLSSREGTCPGATRHHQTGEPSMPTIVSSNQEALQLPPSYQESEYLDRKRLQRSNPSSMSLRGKSSTRTTLIDPKPTIFEPALTSLTELPRDLLSRDQRHAVVSGLTLDSHGQFSTDTLCENLTLSSLSTMEDICRSSDAHLLSLAPQGPPYPSRESDDSLCIDMPEQTHYGYHTASALHSEIERISAGPPYPTSDFEIPTSTQQDHLPQSDQAVFIMLPCEEHETLALHPTQMESLVPLQSDQRLNSGLFDEILSFTDSKPQRTLTARERRRRWYTSNAS